MSAEPAMSPRDFWGRVQVRAPDVCWPWTGARRKNYGVLDSGPAGARRSTGAHRYAFRLVHGYWPTICRHTCDNPPCCNPRHLRNGTVAENSADMVARGRTRHGPTAGIRTREVADTIAALSAAGRSQRHLAAQFGVSTKSVHLSVHGQHWTQQQEATQ